MQELFNSLSNYPWVVNSKPIFSATIPVLKLEINPSIPFEQNNKCLELSPNA